MKVSEALKYLQALNEDDEIIIAWWTKEMFPSISKEDWDEHISAVCNHHDWSYEHAAIEDHFDVCIEQMKEAGE